MIGVYLNDLNHHQSSNNKSKIIIIKDLLTWFFKEHEFNQYYLAFDLIDRSKLQDEYVGRRTLYKIIQKAEHIITENHQGKNHNYHVTYQLMTKDKFIAQSCLNAFNIKCIPLIGLIYDEKFVTRDKILKISDLVSISEFVLKCLSKESSEGFYLCKVIDNYCISVNNTLYQLENFKQLISRRIFVVQPVIKSHSAIRKFNDTALNTTRIVTIRNGPEIIYLGGFQSLATGREYTDNWSKGAVYVGFDHENNILTEKGFFHPLLRKSFVTEIHPDSGIQFAGYCIPFLNEAVKLCIYAHHIFYNHFLLGWDIAITDEGPIIVEVNERPGMNAFQVINGGVKKKVMECYFNTRKYFETN